MLLLYFCSLVTVRRSFDRSFITSSPLRTYTFVCETVMTETGCFVLFSSAYSPKNCPGPSRRSSSSLGIQTDELFGSFCW